MARRAHFEQGVLFHAPYGDAMGPRDTPSGPSPKPAVRKGDTDTSYDHSRSTGIGSGREPNTPPLFHDDPGIVRGIKLMDQRPSGSLRALYHDRGTKYSPQSEDWYQAADKRQTGKTALQARPGFHAGLGTEEIGHIKPDAKGRNGVVVATEHFGNNHFANRAGHGEWVTSQFMRTRGVFDPGDPEGPSRWLSHGQFGAQ